MKHQPRRRACRKQNPLVRALQSDVNEAIRGAVSTHYPAMFKECAGATFEGGWKPWVELWNGIDPDGDRPEVSIREMVADWLKELDQDYHAEEADTCAECFDQLAAACRKRAAEIRSANNAVRGAAEPRTLDGLVGDS